MTKNTFVYWYDLIIWYHLRFTVSHKEDKEGCLCFKPWVYFNNCNPVLGKMPQNTQSEQQQRTCNQNY